MADFKFDFGTSNDDIKCTPCFASTAAEGDTGKDSNTDVETLAFEITWTETDNHTAFQGMTKKQHDFGQYHLVTMTTAAVEEHLRQEKNGKDCRIIQAINAHSDLVAGQYEGGLKVWECSVDLCRYLSDSDLPVRGAQVLELGCGAGLPGMLAARMGAGAVTFQDFNQEVIETYTMVNVYLNSIDQSSCSFFAGDWDSFASLAHKAGSRFDLILTSETIYNVGSYPKLLKVFRLLLADAGSVLVAGKCDYFGVGGSMPSFQQFVLDSGQFQVEEVKLIDSGVPRKILKVTRA